MKTTNMEFKVGEVVMTIQGLKKITKVKKYVVLFGLVSLLQKIEFKKSNNKKWLTIE